MNLRAASLTGNAWSKNPAKVLETNMAITDKTRKLLWGRSGNRCALCRCSLVPKTFSIDDDSIIGDECHIVAREVNGPRGILERPQDIDCYDNLILLCKIHHKIIDDQPNVYSANRLREIKSTHEKWVDSRLDQVRIKTEKSSNQFLLRVTKGTDLLNILVNGNHLFDHGHDELETEEEVELVSSFLQNIHDYGDLLSDLESSHRVRASFELSGEIKELEANGFYVFAGWDKMDYIVNGKKESFACSRVRVLRSTNPAIILINPSSDQENLPSPEY